MEKHSGLFRLAAHDTFFFPHKNALFPHNRFSTHFFSMKMAELGKNVLVSCIIDLDDIQLWLWQFCLNLNICKVMTIFFKFWPKKNRKTAITLLILRFKQNYLSQSWISSKSIMQLTKTIFQNSAIFIEKKWVENRLWGKSAFFWGKRINSLAARSKAGNFSLGLVQRPPWPCVTQSADRVGTRI